MTTQNKQTWTTKAERIAFNVEAGLPADEKTAIRKIRLPLLILRAAIHREIAPTLTTLRRFDDLIHSASSTSKDFLFDNSELETVIDTRPPLPVGLPMPANVCLNPRITL